MCLLVVVILFGWVFIYGDIVVFVGFFSLCIVGWIMWIDFLDLFWYWVIRVFGCLV